MRPYRQKLKMFALLLCFGLALTLSGCASGPKATVSSSLYWKRVFRQMGDDIRNARTAIDRIVFDPDYRPIEQYSFSSVSATAEIRIEKWRPA